MRKKSRDRGCRIRVSVLAVAIVTLLLAVCGSVTVSAQESGQQRDAVIVTGDIFGTRISTKGVLVVGVTGVVSGKSERFPARDAGICSKDIINTVNGKEIENSEDLVSRIENSEGKPLDIGITRGNEQIEVTLTPTLADSDGEYRGGLWVRDSLAGIGTVTFVIPETGEFMGLGHGICDPDTGVLMPVLRGGVFGVCLSEIKRSDAGAPGELRGRLDTDKIGSVIGNTPCGIYAAIAAVPAHGRSFPIAKRDEVRPGDVKIICTLDGNGPREYLAKIERICDAEGETKNFVIRMNDKELLDKCGGIVQGMSGSPIIQDGKLVGAVTHVMINDPTTGYGIFIENMLNAANIPMAKAS